MREHCDSFHPKENCMDENCSIVNCRRRHPQPCRFFGTKNGCRFGSACRFDHQTQMCFKSKLEEMQSKFTQYKQIQDETVKLLNEKIITLEMNLLEFMKGTLVCDDEVTENDMPNKKRKVTIANQIDDHEDKVLQKIPKLMKNDATTVQNDVDMTESNEENRISEYFCENTLKNLRIIESKIKTSKIEETKNCLKNMKEKYKNFTKNYGNNEVNAFFQKDDIKIFLQKLETIHKKWNTYSRNNLKLKSNLDLQELFKELEKIENKKILNNQKSKMTKWK